MRHRRIWGITTLFVAFLLGIGGSVLLASRQPAQGQQMFPAGTSQQNWILDAFLLDGTPQDVLINDPNTLSILPLAHQLGVSDSCGGYTATYSASQGHLHLSHFIYPDSRCLRPMATVEMRFNIAFLQVTTYQFDWTGLRLQDGSGRVLLHFRAAQTSSGS
jgi:hypothetical protein